ncbi:MAG: class I SAM-dependent methyltransferase [Firmicutes bacterium]|nr:class I SAM-dependent methyltransferase [Bacillota bacterium]
MDGTGRYTFHYAALGYAVTAVEVVGDAIELEVGSEQFDVVLCLGPLYHLQEDEEKDSVMVVKFIEFCA